MRRLALRVRWQRIEMTPDPGYANRFNGLTERSAQGAIETSLPKSASFRRPITEGTIKAAIRGRRPSITVTRASATNEGCRQLTLDRSQRYPLLLDLYDSIDASLDQETIVSQG